jgi:hypothetical protein
MFKRFIAALGALLAASVLATAASAQTLDQGLTDPNGTGARVITTFRDFSNVDGSYQLSISSFDSTYVISNTSWGASPQDFSIRFSNGMLTVSKAGGETMAQLPVSSGENWNYVDVYFQTDAPIGQFGITGMRLNRPTNGDWTSLSTTALANPGNVVGPYSFDAASSVNVGHWTITGAQLGSEFELAGALVFPPGTNPNSTYMAFVFGNAAVTYNFDGFFAPVDNGSVVNVVKAGQTIPVKWRLTDANRQPVSDSASFKNPPLSVTEISCDPNAVLDDVEQLATGSTDAPQYLGDGNWQYNWQTKGIAKKCYAMKVEFSNGTSSPPANFKFR